ncbi:MAG: sodium:alanine symporter family protein [Clostridiales bacterium]|nr:sodium:alanine symporter family protein [Clostridiales bacterium]
MTELVYKILSAAESAVWGAPMLILMLGTGIYLTLRSKFFQFRNAGHIVRNTVLSLFKNDRAESDDSKTISQFQSVSAALAATVGTGNIAGVATAVLTGGAGSVFWMWVSSVFGMMTGYAENTLGIYYRKKNEKNEWQGGAMYYIREGLRERKHFSSLGKPIAAAFALFCIPASLGMGNMAQVNSAADALHSSFNIPFAATGAVFAFVIAAVMKGGIKRIGSVTEKLMPIMSIFYIACTLIIILKNYRAIPHMTICILKGAFSTEAVMGGGAGFIMKQAISTGLRRGIFSNEAGLGSSVFIHTASNIKEPAVQGMWSIFEVFFDTILMCSLTAFAILSINVTSSPGIPLLSCEQAALTANNEARIFIASDGCNGSFSVPLVSEQPLVISNGSRKVFAFTRLMTVKINARSKAEISAVTGASLMGFVFEKCFGKYAGKLLAISVTAFAFSTVLGWSYYGVKATEYVFGERVTRLYKGLFVLFIIIGSVTDLKLVWSISDIFNGLMAVPNITGILLLSGKVFSITENYYVRKISKGPKRLRPMISAYDQTS